MTGTRTHTRTRTRTHTNITVCAALLAVAVALSAALLPATGNAARARPAAPAAAATCSPSDLVIWLEDQGNGAAGSVYYNLDFTNLSSRACTLRGYPGVSAISLTGRQLGRPAGRSHSGRVRTVLIRNHRTAKAVLRIIDTGALPPRRCGRTTAAGLRVFAPGATRAKTIPFPFPACARRGVNYMFVWPVRG